MPHAQEKQLRELLNTFLTENAKLNLSALRTEETCWNGNILDSLSAEEILKQFSILHSQFSILDVGTGGGFPLLPLAVALPEMKFTGMDSTGKKIDAVQRIANQMALKNVALVSGRAEEYGHHPRYREQFDIVTARAVAEINVLLEYAAPFVKSGGKIILWKSLDVSDELERSVKAQRELGCKLTQKHVYELPGDFGKRQLLVFEKTGKLAGKFPREVGVAKKKPIL